MASPQDNEFRSTVRGLTSSGEAVVELPDGMVCFVPGAWPAEEIRFTVVEKKKNFARGNLVEVLRKSSARRVMPLQCRYHGVGQGSCGGCPWLFVEYSAQLEQKQNRIEDLFHKLQLSSNIGIAEGALKSIQPSELQWGYRTRAQFKSDGESLGFVPSRGRGIVDVEECPVLTSANNNRLMSLRNRLPEKNWVPSKTQNWTTLDISEDQEEEFLLNKRSDFQQANRGQNEFMRAWLKNLISSNKTHSQILELFCGEGNFTEILADSSGVQSVVSIEGSREAVFKLKNKALKDVRAFQADLLDESAARKILKKCKFESADFLFLDPPRVGLKHVAQWLEVFRNIRAVAYVSCDLATFFRDAQRMCESGFELQILQPVDLFPQTPHCEVLSYFKKRSD